MSDHRSAAEQFVTAFIDYVDKYDIKDELNKRKNIMERSPGIESLIKQANAVFPERLGQEGNDAVTDIDAAIAASPKIVIDTRKMFARKIQQNGAARGLLERVLAGDENAKSLATEFIAAERGEKDFGQEN